MLSRNKAFNFKTMRRRMDMKQQKNSRHKTKQLKNVLNKRHMFIILQYHKSLLILAFAY